MAGDFRFLFPFFVLVCDAASAGQGKALASDSELLRCKQLTKNPNEFTASHCHN
jgi:hypothetical protein